MIEKIRRGIVPVAIPFEVGQVSTWEAKKKGRERNEVPLSPFFCKKKRRR